MKHKTILVFINLLFFFTTQAQEQNVNLSKGNKFFNNSIYFDAIKIYEKVAQKGYQSVELFQKLGDANYFNAQYIEANNWYQKLFELNKEVDAIYYYRYAQTLKSIGNYTKSNQYLSKFAAVNNKSDIALQYLNNNSYLEGLSNHITEFEIKNMDTIINSEYADFGASAFNNTLIFSSTRKSNKKIDRRTNEYYSSLYTIDLSSSNSSPKYFSIKKRSRFNESSPLFSKDGQTIYLTRGGKYFPKKKSANKRVELKIYTATLNKKGKWKKIKELAINNDAYNCAHPALSPDEKTLYFVSDMPGGCGDTDIYKVALANHQTVGEAINLGPNINTSGKESYPFISSNNELYFASNGHLGLGGLDIFKSSINDNQEAGPAYNLGKPINSGFDDFSFFKLNNSDTGYFSSNRLGGKGKDDIYNFFKEKKVTIVDFIFLDEETKKPLENLSISLYDQNHNLINTGQVNHEGKYSTSIKQSKDFVFYIEIKAPEYGTQEITFNNDSKQSSISTTFNVVKPIQNLNISKDLSQSLIKPIYFYVNKYDIRKDAEVELQKLVALLKEYTTVNIEIRTHTDSRLSAPSNLELSKKRALSVKNYLVKNGINPNRLQTKAYGETQLINHCADGIPCSEIEHQANRRCEFIITKM